MKRPLAWAAGLFEGEGCISLNLRPKYGYRKTRLGLSSTDEDVIRDFRDTVEVGVIRGPRVPRTRPHVKPAWRWRLDKVEDVEELLMKFAPFLGDRRLVTAANCLAADTRVKGGST